MMNPKEKASLIQQVKTGLAAMNRLKAEQEGSKGDVEDILLDPTVMRMMLEVVKSFFAMIGGWFGGSKSIAEPKIVALESKLDSMIKLEQER